MESLSNGIISISVSSHGAELTSLEKKGREYLWQADPAFWKRHSPVLFPIVGSLWKGAYRYEGNEYLMSQHGFARDMEFDLLREDETMLRYRLHSSESTFEKYPFHFSLEIGYELEGNKVRVQWQVKNTGSSTMYFQIGAHPAFYYPGFSPDTDGRGYFSFDRHDGLEYILISENSCVDPEVRYPLPMTDGMMHIDTHTFDRDALILEGSQIRKVTLLNEKSEPWLSVHFDAPVVGLWSPPGRNAPFVCIEPWYGRCDRAGFSGECSERDWMMHLSPDEVFETEYAIEIH